MRKIEFIIILSILCLLGTILSYPAYAGYGDWKIYAAYHHASKVVAFNNLLYVISDDGLYSYDPKDTSVETYDKASSLNDNSIFDVVNCKTTNQLVIIYDDGNVDLLDANGDIYNMPELKDKILSDKTINDIYTEDNTVYISTNSGIVILDVKRKVFAAYYDFGHNVNSVVTDNGYFFAMTPDGVYKGKMTDNLLDSNNWIKVSTNMFSKIVKFNDKFYVLNSQSKLNIISNNETFTSSTVDNTVMSGYSICNDKLFFFGTSIIHIYDKDNNHTTMENANSIQNATYMSATYWLACNTKGLIGANLNNNIFTTTVSSIIPNSPLRNYFYRLKTYNNRLISVGGTIEYPIVNRTFTAQMYNNGVWSTFDEDAILSDIGTDFYRNAIDIIQDPKDSEHHYIGASAGLFELQNEKYIKHYTYNNSPLKSILPTNSRAGYFVRITGLSFDNLNNLWMLNNECDTIIRIKKSDGTWLAYYCSEIANHPALGDVVFDDNGWAWINSRISGESNNAGVFVLNTNGTLNQRSDDKQKFIYIIKNQDGTSYQFNNVNAIVKDLNGAIWIGTNYGPFVTYDPSSFFNSDFYFTQCKVPRNDGTKYADYLLNEIEVRCIAVDGGNRKWIGTLGNGVYLVNEDGTKILEHFTSKNSPLLSDDVYSIAIDGTTGEVFFGTRDGLVSYMGNATDPEESFNKNLIKVYPNPVRPEYNGSILITGLMFNTNVKIVNAAGRLVDEGTSIGGEYTWNGKTNGGTNAVSGIYYVFATDSEGTKGVAAKFLIVKE